MGAHSVLLTWSIAKEMHVTVSLTYELDESNPQITPTPGTHTRANTTCRVVVLVHFLSPSLYHHHAASYMCSLSVLCLGMEIARDLPVTNPFAVLSFLLN